MKLRLSVVIALTLAFAIFDVLLLRWIIDRAEPLPAPEAAGVVSVFDSVDGIPAAIGVPVRISIPSISLDAGVVRVALNAAGAMDVPRDPAAAGWYEIGPKPGEEGSAVIAGHVDWYDGAVAAFKDLRRVSPGDVITVSDDQGSSSEFRVRELRSYDAEADAIDVFRATDGLAHLNLITCEGQWDSRANQYEKRLVVFADRLTE